MKRFLLIFELLLSVLKKSGFIFLTVCTAFLLITSCSKKEISKPLIIGSNNNANAMVLSGYGFLNTTFVFNQGDCSGYYDTTLHITSINLSGDTDSVGVSLFIHFNGESVFAAQDTLPGPNNVSDTIAFYNRNTQNHTYYYPLYLNDVLMITAFNNPGGVINGTFSGPYINKANFHDTLKVTNGRFSVTRLPDVY